MGRHLLYIAVFACTLLLGLSGGSISAQAMSFDVTNVQISVQSTDAVKARDLALAQAQRKAFAVLVGQSEAEIEKAVTDTQIARLIRGFSVRGERLAARAYSANFTIRFNPNSTISFVQANGYDFAFPNQTGPINANPQGIAQQQPTQQSGQIQPDGTTAAMSAEEQANLAAQAVIDKTVVVLPVLDIGTQNMLWGDPNPWREIWQKQDYSKNGLSIRVPLGDIADLTDVPDVRFLNGAQYNFDSLMNRYAASSVYIAIVKNQGSGGVLLSLYRHDGKKLAFLKKMIINPRPGFMFNDSVPAAVQMIIDAHNTQAATSTDEGLTVQDQEQQPLPEQELDGPVVAPINTQSEPMLVTIPYQSLQQWVGIQNRLRLTAGITSIVPLRVSPSSAKVRLTANVPQMDLQRNLGAQRFDLQYLPTGEIVLIEQ